MRIAAIDIGTNSLHMIVAHVRPDLSFEVTRHGLGGGAFRVVAPEEQATFLAGLPLLALDLSDELQQTLRRFGLNTLGDVSRLPPGPLAARLGPEGAVLWRLARGEDTAALAPRPSPARFEEGEELEWDVQSIEPLLFVWKALLDRLAQRLRARGHSVTACRVVADGSSAAKGFVVGMRRDHQNVHL